MKRTTILADEHLLLEAKHLAASEGKTFTVFVQDALRDYIAAHRPARRISIVGIANIEEPWTAESLDQALIDDIDPIYGWSHGTPVQKP